MPRPHPDWCKWCDSDGSSERHWKWNRNDNADGGGLWGCRPTINARNKRYYAKRKAHPVKYAAYKSMLKDLYDRNMANRKYKAYGRQDRTMGRLGIPLPWEDAKGLMESACSYCGISECCGLDRIDNSLGHTLGNVVPACGNCNMILNDMPMELKQMFKPVLKEAREKGLFEIWQHPRIRWALAQREE